MNLEPHHHKDTKSTKDTKERSDALSNAVIGAAIEVHRVLGPGLLESVYEECLSRELVLQGIPVRSQVILPVQYKGAVLDSVLRIDMVVDESVVVEVKSVETVLPVHEAQLLSYLRLTNIWLGLLINFNVPMLKNGIKRLVCGPPPSSL